MVGATHFPLGALGNLGGVTHSPSGTLDNAGGAPHFPSGALDNTGGAPHFPLGALDNAEGAMSFVRCQVRQGGWGNSFSLGCIGQPRWGNHFRALSDATGWLGQLIFPWAHWATSVGQCLLCLARCDRVVRAVHLLFCNYCQAVNDSLNKKTNTCRIIIRSSKLWASPHKRRDVATL